MGRSAAAKKFELGLAAAAASVPAFVVKDWNEVDEAIKDVALLDLSIEEEENKLNGIIADAQARFSPRIKELKEERAQLAFSVLEFASAHREDFGVKKSRKFNFGTIAFSKLAERVVFIVEEVKVIANLKRLGLATGVVKEKEWVDKNALTETVPAEKRKAAGFTVEETGNEPQLKIDRKSIEILKQAGNPTKGVVSSMR